MELKRLQIECFRNFEKIEIELKNHNVIFGMNDVGKTNLMYALRFLLDREVRNNGFTTTDFFRNDTSKTIKITLEISLADYEESMETKNIVSKVGGARNSKNLDTFFFQVRGSYDDTEYFGIPKIFWGCELGELIEVPQKGIFSDLDKIFEVVYVDPTIDLEKTFLKHKKKLFDQMDLSESDKEIEERLKQLSKNMNEEISGMELVTNFQNMITQEYKNLKQEEIKIELKSEMAIKGYFNNLIPYIKRNNDEELYPTSGDGRKKILSYSLLNYLLKKQADHKIVIHLIEEPENSLHRSMQIAFSKQLFSNVAYNHFFLTTHSSELLYEMDNASLIRVYSQNQTDSSSYLYKVQEEYKAVKKKLNRSLATALFANTVLLVEGPSEKILFEKVLSVVAPDYESNGGYLLEVDGIDFKPYVDTLKALSIKTLVKTDNDFQAVSNGNYNLLGLNRCMKLLDKPKLENIKVEFPPIGNEDETEDSVKERTLRINKVRIYESEIDTIELLKQAGIYLSKIDLENDLYEVIAERMEETFPNKDAIIFLQKKKLINMIELIKNLSDEDCENIYNHELFMVLRRLTEQQ